jgi:hypothetical protein
MSRRCFFASAVWGAAWSLLAGCSAPPGHPPAASHEQPLTPERAKEALLAMMRSQPGKDLGWFKGDIPDQMGAMTIEEEGNRWYAWTGAFRFNPSERVYTFVVRPRPDAWACAFEYKGSFVSKDGRWSATPPELVSAALQAGQ